VIDVSGLFHCFVQEMSGFSTPLFVSKALLALELAWQLLVQPQLLKSSLLTTYFQHLIRLAMAGLCAVDVAISFQYS